MAYNVTITDTAGGTASIEGGSRGARGPAGPAVTDASLLTTGTLPDSRLSFTVSDFAKTLIDDADASTARTTLGAQASDATLTSLSGLSLAAGDVLYATAADTLARLPKGTAAQVLAMNAGATAPEWVGGCLEFTDVTTLRADTTLTYGNVIAGQIIRTSAEGFAYEIAASGASDHHLTIGAAGVVKLYIKTNASGEWPVNALGLVDGGDLADIADAVNDYCAAGFAEVLRLAPGSYTCSETGLNVVNATLVMDGATIDASAATGTFTVPGIVSVYGDAPTAIPDLSVSPAKGGKTLTFASAHGLAADDWILIYNPTDYSYSGFRTYYRAGEYAHIRAVTSSTVVELWEPLYAGYTAANMECYKANGYASGKIIGGHIIGPLGTGINKSVACHLVRYANGAELDRVSGYTTGSYAASVENSIGYRENNCDFIQRGRTAGTGTYYGRVISNSQDAISIGCKFEGNNHGATTGGGEDYAIPNRGIRTYNFTSIIDQESTGISGVDFHGNTEHSGYYNGVSSGYYMATICGDYNEIKNVNGKCIGPAVLLNELSGVNHIVIGVDAYATGNDTTRGGLVDVGGSGSNSMSANTTNGGELIVKDCIFDAPNHTRHAILVRNRGATISWRLTVIGIVNKVPSDVAAYETVSINTVSGSAATHAQATDISAVPTTVPHLALGASDTATLVRQNPIVGSATLTPASTAVFSATTAATWKSFAKAPRVATWLESSYVGNHEVVSASNTPTKTGANIRVHTTDSTNFTNTTAGTVGYQAALWEW